MLVSALDVLNFLWHLRFPERSLSSRVRRDQPLSVSGPQCSPSPPGFPPRHGGGPAGGGHTHLCSRLMRRVPPLVEQSARTRCAWPLSLVFTRMMACTSVSMCNSTTVLTRGLGVDVPALSQPQVGANLLSVSVLWFSHLPARTPLMASPLLPRVSAHQVHVWIPVLV